MLFGYLNLCSQRRCIQTPHSPANPYVDQRGIRSMSCTHKTYAPRSRALAEFTGSGVSHDRADDDGKARQKTWFRIGQFVLGFLIGDLAKTMSGW